MPYDDDGVVPKCNWHCMQTTARNNRGSLRGRKFSDLFCHLQALVIVGISLCPQTEENSPTCSAICKGTYKTGLEDEDNASWLSDGKAKTEITFLAGGSAGLKPASRGDWMGQKWDARLGFVKMRMMADSDAKKTCAVPITDKKSGDAPGFKKLPDEALQSIGNSANVTTSEELSVGCDGAYDADDNLEKCDKQNVTPIVPVGRNFSPCTSGNKARRKQGLSHLGNCKMNPDNIKSFGNLAEEKEEHESQKQRKKDVGFGNRRPAGTAISTFKRGPSGNVSARAWRNAIMETKFKVMTYSLMTDDALEQKTNRNQMAMYFENESARQNWETELLI